MKQHILIVDDDMPMRCLLKNILSKKYEIICVNSAMEACNWLSDGNFPDLIVSDLEMPEMSGMEFLTTLRESGLYKNIPVVILSTLQDERTKQSCLSEGAVAYVGKPFELEEFLAAIHTPLVSKMFL